MHSSTLPERESFVEASALASKARFWNKAARKYARDPIADVPGYEKTVQRVQTLLLPEHAVLEIGCGTGSTALRLAPGVRRMLATDVSAEMVAIAREKLAAQPVPQLALDVADADAPSSSGADFDAVLAFNVLHLVENLPRTLHWVMDTLKPGGLFISKTPCLSEMNPLIPKVALPLMRALGKAPHVLCLTTAQLKDAMAWQGLEIVGVEWHGSKGKDYRPFIIARKPKARRAPPRS